MVKYSLARFKPEDILEAKVVSLTAGTPYTVEDLSRFSKGKKNIALSLLSFSLAQNPNVEFYVSSDGLMRRLDVYASGVNGIERCNHCLVYSKSSLQLKLSSTADVSNYPIRYVIRVSEPSVIDKLLYGYPLTSDDERIIRKFALTNLISTKTIIHHVEHPVETNIISRVYSSSNTLSAGDWSIGPTITITPGYYGVLEEIGVEGYDERAGSAVTNNVIKVDRDDDTEYLSFNCYAMPPWIDETDVTNSANTSFNNGVKLRVPFIDKLAVRLVNGSDINYDYFRIYYKYSIYVLGIAEKIKWGIPLSSDEAKVADEKDMIDKIKAGLV